jgi:hypothetical protein
MEADRRSPTFQYCAFKIVVETDPTHTIPGGKGGLMTAQEIGHLGIEIKMQEDPAGMAEHHDKGHQLVLSTTDGDVTEVSPVDLALLTRQGLQALKGLGLESGA